MKKIGIGVAVLGALGTAMVLVPTAALAQKIGPKTDCVAYVRAQHPEKMARQNRLVLEEDCRTERRKAEAATGVKVQRARPKDIIDRK